MTSSASNEPASFFHLGVLALLLLCLLNTLLTFNRPDLFQQNFGSPQSDLVEIELMNAAKLAWSAQVRLVKSPYRATPMLQLRTQEKAMTSADK